jgi:two-component system, response regulator PdtaR
MAERPATVLVVDDEEEVREYAAAVFEDLGLAVYRAASGEEALAILERHPEIRVLFSDVRMPGIGGAELAARAHRRWPDLRVVLTSGYVGGVAIEDVEFLPKPYRPRDIRRTVLAGLDGGKE